jgi:hypothetical protein
MAHVFEFHAGTYIYENRGRVVFQYIPGFGRINFFDVGGFGHTRTLLLCGCEWMEAGFQTLQN